MSENDEPTAEDITAALSAMEHGDTLAFPNGGIAHRDDDGGWEITFPPSEDEDQAFYNQLVAAADEYEPGGPRGPKLSNEESFRRLLGGG